MDDTKSLLPLVLIGGLLLAMTMGKGGCGGGTTPTPPPDDLKATAVALAKQAARQPTGAADLATVRGNLQHVADAIAALKDPARTDLVILTTGDATTALNGLNRQALGTRYETYRPQLDAMRTCLEHCVESGKIKQHVYGVGDAYAQIAAGLSAYKADPIKPNRRVAIVRSVLQSMRSVTAPDPAAEKRLQEAYAYGRVVKNPVDDPPVYLDQDGQPETVRAKAREAKAEFRASHKRLAMTFPSDFRGAGKDKSACYWNYALRFDGRGGVQRFGIQQITGNCVAASLADVATTHLIGTAYYLLEHPIDPDQVSGTACAYAGRGHCGQGANLPTVAEWCSEKGFSLRKQYCGGKYDFTDTDEDQRFGMSNCRSFPSDLADEIGKETKFAKWAEFDGGVDEACDVLYAGGVLWCGGTTTWSSGSPVGHRTGVGPHAQTCIGYDARPEVLRELGLDEPIFFFDQTWGGSESSYVKSGWLSKYWGKATRGIGILPWSECRGLLYSAETFAIWPDLSGKTPADIDWSRRQ